MPTNSFVLQSEIERLTGFGVEKLRKWRQRFGFPSAEHGVDGRAIYSRESVDRLPSISKWLLEDDSYKFVLFLYLMDLERFDSQNFWIKFGV